MKILHIVGHSLVRFTPARIACYWGRYTEHTGRAVCVGRHGGWQYRELLNPYGFLCSRGHEEEYQRLVREADVIHCHDDIYPTLIGNVNGKVLVYHAHIGSILGNCFHNGRYKYDSGVRHAIITNGYGRLFDREKKAKWGRLPDILDINHPLFMPNPALRNWSERPLKAVFTHSNSHSPGARINAKCPTETKAIVKKIKNVKCKFVTGATFEQAQAEKQHAHIVIDEIFSPFTHLSTLEGSAVGACVVVNFDEYTRNDLCDTIGAPRDSLPWLQVTPKTIRKTLEHLGDHPDEAREVGKRCRAWMERYYSPEKLLDLYLRFYGRA
jgi:hypothetical protein